MVYQQLHIVLTSTFQAYYLLISRDEILTLTNKIIIDPTHILISFYTTIFAPSKTTQRQGLIKIKAQKIIILSQQI
jgi:hypothetical protein